MAGCRLADRQGMFVSFHCGRTNVQVGGGMNIIVMPVQRELQGNRQG